MEEQAARPRFKIPSPVDPTDSDEEAPQSAQDPIVAYDVDCFFTDIENAIRAGTRFVMLKQAAARWPRHKLRTRPFLFHLFPLIAVAFSIVSPFYRVHYAPRHKASQVLRTRPFHSFRFIR